jgi:hypothetical protein
LNPSCSACFFAPDQFATNAFKCQHAGPGKFSDKDIIVHPDQWQPLLECILQLRVEHFAEAGHFMMLEHPDPFMQKLEDFLDEDIPTE